MDFLPLMLAHSVKVIDENHQAFGFDKETNTAGIIAINDKNKIYEDGANVIGIEFEDDELKVISMFEKLYFLEKLDVFSELFIKYDNDTYFENKIATLSWDKNLSGYDIAKIIQNVKKEII